MSVYSIRFSSGNCLMKSIVIRSTSSLVFPPLKLLKLRNICSESSFVSCSVFIPMRYSLLSLLLISAPKKPGKIICFNSSMACFMASTEGRRPYFARIFFSISAISDRMAMFFVKISRLSILIFFPQLFNCRYFVLPTIRLRASVSRSISSRVL